MSELETDSVDTVAVLALDAADYRLIREWDCQNLLLDTHGPLETFTYGMDVPYTPEVWASVATGLHPREHGVAGRDLQQWDNPILRAASHITKHLPTDIRRALGRPFRDDGTQMSFPTTNEPHLFGGPDRAVYSWPGVNDAPTMMMALEHFDRVLAEHIPGGEFLDELHHLAGQEIGWLLAATHTNHTLVGTHSHCLDLAGHVFADKPDRLRTAYQRADHLAGILRENTDRLVILSDHGMQTTHTDDPDIGQHSMRAYIASEGIHTTLPEDIMDVYAWLNALTDPAPDTTGRGDVEVSDDLRDHLADLGYVEGDD